MVRPFWRKVVGVLSLALSLLFHLRVGAEEDLTDRFLSLPGSFSFVRRAPQGEEAGKVRMVVFEDFLCPVCYRVVTELVPEVQKKYGRRLEVTFIGYPLVAEESVIPAQAYALAREMGLGEEMQRSLFSTHFEEKLPVYTREGLARAVSRLGLDPEDFLEQLRAGKGSERVKEEAALAESYRIDSVPGIVLDGWIRINELSRENLERVIEGLLARKGSRRGW